LQKAKKEFTEGMMEAGYHPFGPLWIREPSISKPSSSKDTSGYSWISGIIVLFIMITISSGGCYLWSVARSPTLEEKIATVHFASNSYTRIYEPRSLLDSVAFRISELLMEDSNITVILKGHSDSRGAARYNLWLSKRRAQTIGRYLTKQGIPKERIMIEAYGEDFPIASNSTPEGRRSNRRVEIVLQKPNRPTFEGYLRFLGLKEP